MGMCSKKGLSEIVGSFHAEVLPMHRWASQPPSQLTNVRSTAKRQQMQGLKAVPEVNAEGV